MNLARGWRSSGVRLKFSFFSMLGLIQLLLIGLSALFTLIILESLEEWEMEKSSGIARYIQNEIAQETQRVVLAVQAIANDQSIAKAFAERDRSGLLSATRKTFEELKRFGIQQMQFSVPSPAGTVTFLRVHNPDEHGEINASYRPTVVKCNLERQLIHGLEQGKSGYGFRGVIPVFYQGEYAGCAEFGSSLGERFLERLNSNYAGRWAIINLARSINTVGGDKIVVAAHGQSDEEARQGFLTLPEATAKRLRADKVDVIQDRSSETVSVYIPVRNFSNDVALYVRHSYHTDFYAKLRRVMWTSGAICLFGLLLSGLIILALYRQITRPINALVTETERIKNFQLDGKLTVSTRMKELQNLVAAITSMKIGLSSFQKYVPAQLVRQLIETNQEARINGERRELTVLFTDIADFTSISESLKPPELAAQLSTYLNAVTDAIMAQKGTVDKYIGDSVMAFWGAPLELKNHATLAAVAALRVQASLVQIGQRWAADGKPVFRTRIGINTGDVIVGNMGSEQRLSYTVIGDSVNLASRLEGINKTYGTGIIMSEATYKRCCDDVEARVLDFTRVKGKSEVTTIYELVAERGDISTVDKDFLEAFAGGVGYYRDRNWEKAIKTFTALAKKRPDDRPTEMFLRRSIAFKAAPPSEDWEGLAA